MVNLIYCLYNDSSIAEVPIDQLKDASYLFADNVAFLYYMYMAEYAYYINNEFADSLSYFEYGGVFEPLSSDFFAPVIYVKINWSSRSKLRHYVYLTLKVLPLKNPV